MDDKLVKKISEMCRSSYGSVLLQLMDFCNKNSLNDVTDEEANDFLEKVNNDEVEVFHFYNCERKDKRWKKY